jgi:hypothetical protein
VRPGATDVTAGTQVQKLDASTGVTASLDPPTSSASGVHT